MNSMTYRGYTARIEFDERDDLFWGKVLGLPDTVSSSLSKAGMNNVNPNKFHVVVAGFTIAQPNALGAAIIMPIESSHEGCLCKR